jgi:hypothetical protein
MLPVALNVQQPANDDEHHVNRHIASRQLSNIKRARTMCDKDTTFM